MSVAICAQDVDSILQKAVSVVATMVGHYELHCMREGGDGRVHTICSTGGQTVRSMLGFFRTGAMPHTIPFKLAACGSMVEWRL